MMLPRKKSNLSFILMVFSIIILLVLLFFIAKLMIFNDYGYVKYKNPVVATNVVEGTISDRNGKKLYMAVPEYNILLRSSLLEPVQIDSILKIVSEYTGSNISEMRQTLNSQQQEPVLIAKNISQENFYRLNDKISEQNLSDFVIFNRIQKKIYPFGFHSAHLIKEIEKNLSQYISPIPELNKETTYGSNIYLTLDMDIQFLLDSICEKLGRYTDNSIIGCVLDSETGAILAITTYPFLNPDNDNSGLGLSENALLSNIHGLQTYFIDRIENINSGTQIDGKKLNYEKMGFSVNRAETIKVINDENSCILTRIANEKSPRLTIFLGFYKAPNGSKAILQSAIKDFVTGLKARGIISQAL